MLKYAKQLKTNETEYTWTGQNQERKDRNGEREGTDSTSVHSGHSTLTASSTDNSKSG